MTREAIEKMVREQEVCKPLLQSLGLSEPAVGERLTTEGMLKSAIYNAISSQMEDALVGLIMGAQNETVERCWEIMRAHFVGDVGTRNKCRVEVWQEFPGVRLP